MSARYTGGLVYNPPGGWSGYFDGTGDYLTTPTGQTALTLSTSDFTIEMWAYPTTQVRGNPSLFASDPGIGLANAILVQFGGTTGQTALWVNNTQLTASSTNNYIRLNQWNHIAICRSGGNTYTFYINGVAVNNVATNSTSLTTNSWYLGYWTVADNAYTGYLSNFRIVKGTAIYTANFMPPTGALLPISGTSLLTCAYPTFRDGSTNNFTITVTGNTAVNTANPFPTSQSPNPALGGAGNGIYTMSQYAALLSAGTWPAYDPYYENVTLNLHGNAGAVLPFNTDASTNNFQVTQVGNTSPSNYTPFTGNGYYSNYFDGASDYLTLGANSAFAFGTGDFTVECWINTSTTSADSFYRRVYMTDGPTGNVSGNFQIALVPTTGYANLWDGTLDLIGTSNVCNGAWNHIAATRSGTTLRLFVNGVQEASTTYSVNVSPNSGSPRPYIGTYDGTQGDFSGYMTNLRVVKGTAVYTSAFTPSTTPLTAISGTSLLTCQSNRFIDNSTNAFTVTPNGNVAVNPYQPFTAPTGTSAYGSGYFDGSGDYLRAPTGYLTGVTTGNFTVEGWWNFGDFTVRTTYFQRLWSFGTGLANDVTLNVDTSGNLVFRVNDSIIASQSSGAMKLNSWNHVALVRSSGTVTIYLNGTSVASAANSSNISGQAGNPFYIGCESDGAGGYFYGYCSNVRITNTAVYTTTFTPSTTPLTAVSGTSLLTVQTNAPSQNNTFLDSSTNNFVITRNGNTTQGTFTPYGSNWSNYFDGTGDYLTAGSSISLSGNFTVEGWVYRTVASGNGNYLFGLGNDTFSGGATFFVDSSTGYLRIYTSQAHLLAGTSAAVPLNTWTHVAFVRSSNTLRAYLNGVQVDSASWSATISGTAYINAELNGNPTATVYSGSAGYLSNIRINTTAVYTAAFTPSTAPLTAITGTALLTCADNRFIDDSTNAYTITRNGDTSVQRFSPFSPSTAYSTSVIGGSGYFDGTGDYLTLAANNAFAFSGDFCIEFWAYKTSNTPGNYDVVFGTGDSGTGVNGYFVELSSTRGFLLAANNAVVLSYAMNPNTAAWNHYAVTRSGSTLRLFVGGVVVASATYSTSLPSTVAVRVGGTDNTFFGYLSDVRVVKGSAVYTTTYTLPTAPLTAITNTSLLTSFTNAAIIDNAMMNNLETVGNAQLSTSVKKYGSASIYFDGSGDWLFAPKTADMVIPASSTFTMECWAYLTGAQNTFRMLVSEANGNSSRYLSINSAGIEAQFGGSSGTAVASNYIFTLNIWYHIALVRNGTTVSIYINGQSQSVSNPTQTNAFFDVGTGMYIGRWGGSPSYEWPGYIDDLRITKGVARYTTSFTPPTSQLQDQ